MKTFKEYIKETQPYVVKKESECSDYELILFHQMLRKGGIKTTIEAIGDKAEYLGFAYEGPELIGVAAAKKPLGANFYFKQAGIPNEAGKYKFEIGWSYVEEKYRNRGTNSKLVEAILKKVNVPVFCVIQQGNSASVASYQKLGFKVKGDPFDWSGNLVMLFVKE